MKTSGIPSFSYRFFVFYNPSLKDLNQNLRHAAKRQKPTQLKPKILPSYVVASSKREMPMRQMIAALFLLFGLCTSHAKAEIGVDLVRQVLNEQDFDKLEQIFDEGFDRALEENDFSKLREVHGTLFVTANVERLGLLKKWGVQHPDSPHALTAQAWSHYLRAHMYRGGAYVRHTYPPSMVRFRRELAKANSLVDQVLLLNPNYVPNLDLAIVLNGSGKRSRSLMPLVDRTLELSPSRHSIDLALQSIAYNRRAPLRRTISLCVLMADRAPDYDAELCFLEAAFKNNVQGVLRSKALKTLAQRDEPFLDYARLDAYLKEWKTKENAFDEVKRIHRASLGPETNIQSYMFDLDQIHLTFDAPFYRIEAKDALVSQMRKRLKDSPDNYRIRRFLIKDLLERRSQGDPFATIEKIQEHWRAMRVMGEFHPITWEVALSVDFAAKGTVDLDQLQKIGSTEIHYALNAIGYVRSHMHLMFHYYRVATGETRSSDTSFTWRGKELEYSQVQELVKCPLFRAARLFNLLCQKDPHNSQCNIGGANSDDADRITRLMHKTDKCEWIRSAEAEELYYAVEIEPSNPGTY